jgi:hypothetical protein
MRFFFLTMQVKKAKIVQDIPRLGLQNWKVHQKRRKVSLIKLEVLGAQCTISRISLPLKAQFMDTGQHQLPPSSISGRRAPAELLMELKKV